MGLDRQVIVCLVVRGKENPFHARLGYYKGSYYRDDTCLLGKPKLIVELLENLVKIVAMNKDMSKHILRKLK